MASTQVTSPISDDIDRLVEELLNEYHVPALSIAVVENGQVHSKGYGYSNLPSTAATADTLYYAGSTTKACIAAVIGKLMEDPKYSKELNWSTPLKQVLKEDFVLSDEWLMNNCSIEDCLSHRSGLPRHDQAYGWTGKKQIDVVRTMQHMPMTETPRSIWQYCNVAYGALGALIEELTSKTTGQILQEYLYGPLGMESTFFDLTSAAEHATKNTENNLARGYYWLDPATKSTSTKSEDRTNSYLAEPYVDLDCVGAAGTNISSVNDYAIWIKALLSAAKDSPIPNSSPDAPLKPALKANTDSNLEKPVISPELFTQLVTPRSIMSKPFPFAEVPTLTPVVNPDLYALAWFISPRVYPGELLVHHSGGLTGFGAQLYLLPEYDFGLVTMANTTMTSNIVGELVGHEIMMRKLGWDEEKRKKSFSARKLYVNRVLVMCGMAEETEQDRKKREEEEERKKKSSGKEEQQAEKEEKGPTKHAFLDDILSKKTPVPEDYNNTNLEGDYHNQAYGTYTFKVVDEDFVDGLAIRRRLKNTSMLTPAATASDKVTLNTGPVADLDPVPSTVTKTPTASAKTNPSNSTTTIESSFSLDKHPIIFISPKGKRTWQARMLSRHQSSSTSTHIFSLEPLKLHGQISTDATNFPDAPIPAPAESELVVYEGAAEPTPAGVVFVPGGDGKEGAKGKDKVGIKFIPEMDANALRDGSGWEAGYIWFERE